MKHSQKDIKFSTFEDIAEKCRSKKIVFFGAGNIAKKTSKSLNRTADFIIDNNPNLWGVLQDGIQIKPPKYLHRIRRKNIFIIICTTSYNDVSAQLIKMKFYPGVNFIVSPTLKDIRIISELESLKTKLLFSSGTPVDKSSLSGGGIYELSLNQDWTYRKVFDGTTHGLIHFEGNFVATHHELGLVELDSKYRLIRNGKVPAASRPHGIAYSRLKKRFYVAASYMDAILIFNKDFRHIDTINISKKYEIEGDAQHHCNDICVKGESLYVSMFSEHGIWKKDTLDGVVLEIDIKSKRIKKPVIRNLKMPHNVSFISGQMVVLDSLRGELKIKNGRDCEIVGKFPGFTRGLTYDGHYYYLGQSRNRNHSKCLGLSKNISIDTSVIVFDKKTKVSRSLFLPSKLSEIHSILIIK